VCQGDYVFFSRIFHPWPSFPSYVSELHNMATSNFKRN
jgi:hypothetical protein